MGGFIVKSTAENLLLWEQRIKERNQSGIKVEGWCEKNGISKHQYYYWYHRVRENKKSDDGIIFADISNLSKTNTARQKPVLSSDFKILINEIQVTVSSDFNPESLAGLMKVLQKL
jgi:hypothetical protein